MLCDTCINQLIKSYEFMMKVHAAEERLVAYELNLKNKSDNEIIEMEFLVEEDTENIELNQNSNNCNQIESIDVEPVIENIECELVAENTIETVDVVSIIDENLDIIEHDIVEPAKNTKSLKQRKIKNKSINKTLAKGKYCIAMPRFVIKNQHQSLFETDYNSSIEIKTMDVEAIEIKYNDLKNITKDMEIIEDPLNSTKNITYSCKYCPKAYSTTNHLILHARKCHLCQFCLKGFVKTFDLFAHIHEMHSYFDCLLCTKNFTKNSSLRSHLKRNHDISMPANVSLVSINI